MEAHRTEAVVEKGGSVTVRDVPFPEGEQVEVIVRSRERAHEQTDGGSPLRGSVRRYEQAFDPASDADNWDALGDGT